MAVAYRSQANSGWTTSASVDITKPSGLAVGDVMVLFWAGGVPGGTPTGWTAIPGFLQNADSALPCWAYAKIADSSDVAASSFSFGLNASALHFGVMVAVSGGTNLTSLLVKANSGTGISNTATPSIAGLTPDSRGNSILLQFWHGATSVSSIASYAIATSNPTWTEVLDSTDGGGNDVSVAWAVRPEVTATGNFSCAGGTASSDWVGLLVSIAPGWITTPADSVTVADSKTMALGQLTNDSVSVTESSTNTKARIWSTDNKNTSSWTNTTKH